MSVLGVLMEVLTCPLVFSNSLPLSLLVSSMEPGGSAMAVVTPRRPRQHLPLPLSTLLLARILPLRPAVSTLLPLPRLAVCILLPPALRVALSLHLRRRSPLLLPCRVRALRH